MIKIYESQKNNDELEKIKEIKIFYKNFFFFCCIIICVLCRFPENKEVVNIGNIRFVVEEVDKNRIKKVRIYT